MRLGVNQSQGRGRIERLEKLVKRLLAAASAGALTSFAGPIVANQAAATALPAGTYTTARQVYTLAQEAIWQYVPGVPGAVGVPPLTADEVITAAGGVLARTNYSSPKWRIGVNDVYIDPANGAASNENTGFDPALPLLTGYELHRRRGWDDSKPIVGPNFATSPDGYSNINIMSDVVSPDSLPIKVTIAANATMRVRGNTPTVIRSAVLTNAVVAQNPAVPLGGTRLQIRDNLLANWTAFMVPNRRVRMIDGPAAGGTLQPQTNQAGGAVDCSPCQTTAGGFPTFSTVPTEVTPAVGNTYHVEQLTVCNLGEIDITQELNPAFGADTFFDFVDINLPFIGTGLGGSQTWAPRSGAGVFLNFYQCTVDRSVDASFANLLLIACYAGAIAITISSSPSGNQQSVLVGGGMNGNVLSGGPGSIGQIVINGNSRFEVTVDFNFVANACISAITGGIRGAAFWNALILAGVNTAGHGLLVGGGGTGPFFGMRGDLIFKSTVWGNTTSAAATGCLIAASCSGVGPPQNITGPGGDCKLANFSATVGNNTFWQAATGLDVGATGVAGVVSASSWAFITAAQGAPGYGGSVHNRDQNASFVATETTA